MKKAKLYLSIPMLLLLLSIPLTAYARSYQAELSSNFQLLLAAAWGDFDGVSHALYRAGADINTRDQYGWTALMWAASGRHTLHRPHRLVDQDAALSRLKPEFESPWGH
mgnify:CR=1 FL=1